MSNLKKVIYLTKTQYETLVENGSITVGGVTHTYDPDNDYRIKFDLTTITNRNLLDNSWFTVNQRKITTKQTINSYFVDRWIWTVSKNLSSGDFTVNTDSTVTLTAASNNSIAAGQRIEKLPNGIYTLSVLESNGTMHTRTVEWKGSALTPVAIKENIILNLELNDTYPYFKVALSDGATITIKAVKLELGYTSTLANDIAPDYTTELLKCQRYFFSIGAYPFPLATGLVIENNVIRFTISCPVEMRTTPSVSYVSLTASNFSAFVDGTSHALTDLPAVNNKRGNNIYIDAISTTAVTSGKLAALRTDTTTGYIAFSADL